MSEYESGMSELELGSIKSGLASLIDRLKVIQTGELASKNIASALSKLEEATQYLNTSTEEQAEGSSQIRK